MPDATPRSLHQLTVPGLASLFGGFFGIGIVGFGGVLPWARRMVVEKRGWLTSVEFNDLLALCQFLPGPNIVNMCVAVGGRYRGALGSVACVAGLLAAPMAIVVGLGGVYGRYGHYTTVAHAFGGLAAAASGLVVAMAIKIAAPLRGRWVACSTAGVAFVAIALFRLPLLPTMLTLAPLSVLLNRRWPG